MAGEMAKPEGGRPRPGGTLRFPLRGLTEAEAFRLLQKQSMEKRKSMRQIAEAIILASELRETS